VRRHEATHKLRIAFAIHALESDADMRTSQDLLDHNDASRIVALIRVPSRGRMGIRS